MSRSAVVRVHWHTTAALLLASATGVSIFLWPLVLRPRTVLAADQAAPVLLAAVLAGVLLTVFVELGSTGVDARAVALLGLLSAVGAALRPLSAGSAGIEFVFFFIILGGRVFGPGFGFVLGSTTLFSSALLTGGLGPWLPYQMLASSWLGMGAGLLPARLRGRGETVLLCAYSAVAGFLYGQIMNLSFWPFVSGPGTALSVIPGAPLLMNLHRFALFSLTTSLGWDLVRAATLCVGVAVIGPVTVKTLRRAAAPGIFVPPRKALRPGQPGDRMPARDASPARRSRDAGRPYPNSPPGRAPLPGHRPEETERGESHADRQQRDDDNTPGDGRARAAARPEDPAGLQHRGAPPL